MGSVSSFSHDREKKPRAMAPPPPEGVYIDWGPELPASYAMDRIVALPRDPFSVYFYWELTGPKYEDLRRSRRASALQGAILLLRITHIDSGKTIEIFPHSVVGNWYFQALPRSYYKAVIGYLLSSEEFVALAESNLVRTPAAGPGSYSARTPEEMRLAAELHAVVFSAGSSRLGITSPSRFFFPSSRRW
jgi:hypothetical protein